MPVQDRPMPRKAVAPQPKARGVVRNIHHELYVGGVLSWPSERYAQEYGPRSTYLPARLPEPLPADAARRRVLVDLPERW